MRILVRSEACSPELVIKGHEPKTTDIWSLNALNKGKSTSLALFIVRIKNPLNKRFYVEFCGEENG